MVTWRKTGALALVALLQGAGGGCAARAQVTTEEVQQLRDRVAELERQQSRLRVRFEDTENRVYLLQDRVEATRMAMQQGGAEMSPVSPLRPSAPPPAGPARPRAWVPDLPVESVEPAAGAWQGDDGAEEVVITQERYDALFGRAGAAVGGGVAARGPGDAPRQALPPVVPSTERLPVLGAGPGAGSPAEARPLDVYQRALDLFHEREYERALGEMQRFLSIGPPANYEDNALYWIGECYYGMGRWAEALPYFQRVVSEFARGNKAADSMLKVALTYERLGRSGEAREVLEMLVQAHPGTPSARRAADRLRDLN